ncbi:MAG: DMT family transporter [Chloroflexi bacterium]|nr:MAG: DMT family transporter [Chloroflexota bacterium]
MHRNAYISLVIGVSAVSLAAIFIRLAQAQSAPSILIAMGRLLIAASILTPVILRRADYLAQLRKMSWFELRLALISGFFLAIHFFSWVTSLEHTTVLISVVLVTTTSIWVAVLEVLFLRAYLSKQILLGLIIALIGGLVIGLSGISADLSMNFRTPFHQIWVQQNQNQLLGAGLSILGAVAVAIYFVIGRKLRHTLSLTPYIWLVYSIAAFIMLCFVFLSDVSMIGYSLEGYLWILALGLIPQLIGHSSLNYALAYLPATYVSLSTQTEPILSAIVAYFVFREVPSVFQVIGGVIIMCGVVIATYRKQKKTL